MSKHQAELFDTPFTDSSIEPMPNVQSLDQYMTPVFAAEKIIERYFPELNQHDIVIEPSCGDGRFLAAVPRHTFAVGVEIDAQLADRARRRSGRQVITGDFRSVALDLRPTAIIGNPPFNLAVIDQFLARAHALLPTGGRVGFVLPSYVFATAARVCAYGERWSIFQDMLPGKNLFPGIRYPLVFAIFSKDVKRTLVGFALYRETAALAEVNEHVRKTLMNGQPRHGSIWREVVHQSLERLGGSATLSQIYSDIEKRRPSSTTWWREQVRKVLQAFFVRVGPGSYAIPQQAAAA